MHAGTEVRVKDDVATAGGMRGVTTNPLYRVAAGIVVVQLIGVPLGLMEFQEYELEVI